MRHRKTLIMAIVTMGIFLLFNIALSGNITVTQLPEASKSTVEKSISSAEKAASTSEASKQKTEKSSALKTPLILSRPLPFLLAQP